MGSGMRPSSGGKRYRVDLLFVAIVRAQGEAQDRDIGEEIPIGSQRLIGLLTDRDRRAAWRPPRSMIWRMSLLGGRRAYYARSIDEELTTTKLCLDPVLCLGDL